MADFKSSEPLRIKLSEERRAAILRLFKDAYREEFDEEISDFRAEKVIDFFVRTLGPSVYNQAIQDARKFMLAKLDDLDVEFYETEAPG
jgi:uncharacterized protein (DUF2164 family)